MAASRHHPAPMNAHTQEKFVLAPIDPDSDSPLLHRRLSKQKQHPMTTTLHEISDDEFGDYSVIKERPPGKDGGFPVVNGTNGVAERKVNGTGTEGNYNVIKNSRAADPSSLTLPNLYV